MEANDDKPGKIKSLYKAFDIIETIQRQEAGGVTEIAEQVDLAESSVHAYLSTLEDLEYLVNENGTYHLSLKFLDHGMLVRNNIPLVEVARPAIEDIVEETGEIAWLFTEEHGHAVYLDMAKGSHGVEARGRVGQWTHLHSIAAGKVILAHLPDERVDEIIEERGLPELTPNTITDPQTLREELEQIREDGYALNETESTEGTRAVAVPILGDETVLGSISIAGPRHRLKGDYFRSELPNLLLGTANEIEIKLKHH